MKLIQAEWTTYAARVFTAMITGLSDGAEPTPGDLSRIDSIEKELKAFADDVEHGRA